MKQNMEANKQNRTGRNIVITALVICLVGFVLFLVGCNQEEFPLDIPTGAPDETRVPASIPNDSRTPTQGEKAAEVASQQFVPEYFPNKDECHEAVTGRIVTECMYAGSVKSITRPEWEQFFPETEFYLIRLNAYHPENEYGDFSSRDRLVARQDDRQYTAETFNQLLSVNSIRVTNENYELVAQAFALMTLNAEIFSHEIVFTAWEPIDFQDAFSHYGHQLTAWTELGGSEIQWRFGFEEGEMMEIMGPYGTNTEIGDYVPLPDIVNENHNYATGLSSQYRFSFNE